MVYYRSNTPRCLGAGRGAPRNENGAVTFLPAKSMRMSKLELLTRWGFAARGLTYLMVAYLAVRSGRPADGPGALGFVAQGSGRILVGLMAAGFLSYGIWRVTDALSDTEGHGSGEKGAGGRLAAGASGLVHLGLAILAGMLALGERGGSGGDGQQHGTAAALGLPGGSIIVGIAAVTLLAVALWQGVKAWRCTFLRHLSAEAKHEPWAMWLGRAGYSARGLVFLGMAWFLGRAALSADASQAGGLAQVLASEPAPLRIATAAGLALFGLYSLVEARYRRINERGFLASLKRALP